MADPTLTALLTAWSWRPEVLLVLAALGSAYTLGWWRLRNAAHRRGPRGWRLVAYLSGLVALTVALLSPIHQLASRLFTAHMIQHLLLTMVAAPLLLLGNPLPSCLWGLPRWGRRAAGRLLTRNAAFRKALWALTQMPVAWLVYVGTLWAWHLPAAYEAALSHHVIHDAEHVTFFGTALLFWWPVIEPAPRLHRRIHPGFGIVYLLAATGQNTLLGALIALPEQVLYPYYTSPPHLFGLRPLDDQALAGGLMWTSGHMYLLPILLVVARILRHEERETRQRQAARRRSA
jgi:cytochrome c oxidase assembly factor CtaG